jgi:hypothetical protein
MVNGQGVADRNAPSYRVFFHALNAIVNNLIPVINNLPDFRDAAMAALNNNTYIQLITNGKKSGDDLILKYYTKFPAVYEGYPVVYNKSYSSTQQKGRLGFKLAKAKPSDVIQPNNVTDKIKAAPSIRPGKLATKKKPAVNKTNDMGRKEVK